MQPIFGWDNLISIILSAVAVFSALYVAFHSQNHSDTREDFEKEKQTAKDLARLETKTDIMLTQQKEILDGQKAYENKLAYFSEHITKQDNKIAQVSQKVDEIQRMIHNDKLDHLAEDMSAMKEKIKGLEGQ